MDAGCGAYLGLQLGTPGLTPRTGPVHGRTGTAHLARSPSHLPSGDNGPKWALGAGPHGARLCRCTDVSRGPLETQLGVPSGLSGEEPAPLHLGVMSSSPILDGAITIKYELKTNQKIPATAQR